MRCALIGTESTAAPHEALTNLSAHKLVNHRSTRAASLLLSQTAHKRRRCFITASSKRQPKDPKKYATMDELRTHLTQQQGNGGLSGFLSWMGSTAFGASRYALLCATARCRLCFCLCSVPAVLCNSDKHAYDLHIGCHKNGVTCTVLTAQRQAWRQLTGSYCKLLRHKTSQVAYPYDLVI